MDTAVWRVWLGMNPNTRTMTKNANHPDTTHQGLNQVPLRDLGLGATDAPCGEAGTTTGAQTDPVQT